MSMIKIFKYTQLIKLFVKQKVKECLFNKFFEDVHSHIFLKLVLAYISHVTNQYYDENSIVIKIMFYSHKNIFYFIYKLANTNSI